MTEEQWKTIAESTDIGEAGFFCACRTTGIVCRPSCPSKTPRRENIIIFEKLSDAVAEGFRPCMRCRPDDPDWHGAAAELAERAKDYMDAHCSDKFSLRCLSETLFVDPDHLERTFKRAYGCTLLDYHNRSRCGAAARYLCSENCGIAEISWKLGFSSPSHFTRVFRKYYGCTPSAYRSGCEKSIAG
jgi:AraC family transcriptional regulator of adaptative response / methylphosphotriester-DNA alkyltransferase methyltransferase